MAVTYATFIARWPEFAAADQTLIETIIAEAEEQANETVFGDQYDAYILALAADMLAHHPFGEPARLSDDKTKTMYAILAERIRKQRTFGKRNG